jgi:sulfite exporter TauE/SafE
VEIIAAPGVAAGQNAGARNFGFDPECCIAHGSTAGPAGAVLRSSARERHAAGIAAVEGGDVGSVLLLGFLIGMQHALEADHVAAVASIATRGGSVRRIVRQGAAWGLGHSITLLVVGVAALSFDSAVPETLAPVLEFSVGVMLVLLGLGVLRCLLRERIHFHRHRHGDGIVHIHAHSHAGERGPHDPRLHRHGHRRDLRLRALLIGTMHGMAGSAALLVLALASVQSAFTGLLYVVIFGFGSIVGMAALSAIIAVPLSWSARLLTRLNQVLQAAIGTATLVLGGVIVYETAFGAWIGG